MECKTLLLFLKKSLYRKQSIKIIFKNFLNLKKFTIKKTKKMNMRNLQKTLYILMKLFQINKKLHKIFQDSLKKIF